MQLGQDLQVCGPLQSTCVPVHYTFGVLVTGADTQALSAAGTPVQRGLGGPLPNFTALSPTQLHGLTQQVSPGFQQQHQMFGHQHTAELPSQGEQRASLCRQEKFLPQQQGF